MKISPETRYKFNKFRKNRKAYWSLIILMIMFLASLPAELIFNDQPLLLKVDGRYYFPFLRKYSMQDFGGTSNIPIISYSGKDFMNFLEGVQEKQLKTSDLFGGDDEEDDAKPTAQEAAAGTAPSKKSYWFLWAPIRHSYKSNTENPKCGERVLVAPWERYDKYKKTEIKSSVLDQHYLGTDKEGKDVLARIVYGFRISMMFGLCLAVTETVLGCIIGAIQGYFGGWIDLIGQRLTEIWGSIPQLFLLIILSSFLASRAELNSFNLYLMLFGIINLTAWMGMATFMRAEFLKGRNLDYVKAARALGASDFKIMLRHILPNSLTPLVTFIPFAITSGILALVSLDFLALGVKYPSPSIGELLKQGQDNLHATWIIIPTFFILSLTLTLLTFIGDGIRSAFDPRAH